MGNLEKKASNPIFGTRFNLLFTTLEKMIYVQIFLDVFFL